MQLSSSAGARPVPGSSAPSEGEKGGAGGKIGVWRDGSLEREVAARMNAGAERRAGVALLRIAGCVLAGAVCYYVSTRIAWSLCFPDSKVSLFFPPQAVLLTILL